MAFSLGEERGGATGQFARLRVCCAEILGFIQRARRAQPCGTQTSASGLNFSQAWLFAKQAVPAYLVGWRQSFPTADFNGFFASSGHLSRATTSAAQHVEAGSAMKTALGAQILTCCYVRSMQIQGGPSL